MELSSFVDRLRNGKPAGFPSEANNLSFAQSLDSQDSLSHLRDEFILPTRASLRKKALDGTIPGNPSTKQNGTSNGSSTNGASSSDGSEQGIYFVGNSLGAQPKAVREYINAQLETWASIGVGGHFTDLGNSPLTNWQDMAADCAKKSADIVGSSPYEIVIMNTLTANLHFMMASFYKPTEKRHKIILEWRPFPSDYYAIESQITWHGLSPERSMVKIEPDKNFLIPTEKILATIDEHGDETALILLPGIQYYSGQYFDIPRITAHAHSKGIVVGWDLAHAAGNVSNPSAIDLASLSGALSVFGKTTMRDLRSKALVLTAYAEYLLDEMNAESGKELFKILTPRDPAQRGTQLSVLLAEGLLDSVIVALEENGAVCDKRKPDVIRVAPVPLYSRFEDVWKFMQVLRGALGLKKEQ
ncbi:unnamed protein product [Clonostachys rosea f. rosea IK726]|uniref:Kynureninase n=2 Tax=Bionectria ochroleuca TaxID=29856 RepID=A0A0B7JJ45_BIOOC|nr:unnamed protein product [Clonostachys rosea f. rosea IK726]